MSDQKMQVTFAPGFALSGSFVGDGIDVTLTSVKPITLMTEFFLGMTGKTGSIENLDGVISAEEGNQLVIGVDNLLYVGDARRSFVQPTPSMVWTVPHNLGSWPTVQVLDHLGEVIVADVKHVDEDVLQVSFSVPMTGTVLMN